MTKTNALTRILDEYASHFDNLAAAALPLGITSSRLARLIKGEPPDVITTLRIAHASGSNVTTCLRAIGKHDVADTLDALYGPATPTLPHLDREWLDLRRGLSPDHLKAVTVILKALSES